MSEIFILLGSIFILITAIGLIKFDTPITKAHALSKALTLGISLMLIGLIPNLETTADMIKVLLAILFLVTTIPLSGHLFANYIWKNR